MSTRFRYALPGMIVAAVMMIGLTGCDWDDQGASLFDPNYEAERPDPVVTEVLPGRATLAGVGRVDIHGANFSSNPEQNVVLFGDSRATVLEASPERLVVRAANVEGEDVALRVTVLGAEHFAETASMRLIPAVTSRGGLVGQESPRGIVVDDDGNIYTALFFGASPSGIVRITPDNQREQLVPAQGWSYVDMAMHPDGDIYLARGGVPIVYRMDPADPSTINAPWLLLPAMGAISRLDVDEWGNVWAGGTSGNISRLTPEQERTAYPFAGDIRGMSYGNGYLYVSAIRTDLGGLWRAPVTASGAGAFEQVLDFGTMNGFANFTPGDVQIRDNGNVFFATSRGGYTLLEVTPGGDWASYYGNLSSMQPTLTGMSLGPDNYLYGARQGESGDVVRIDLQWEDGR